MKKLSIYVVDNENTVEKISTERNVEKRSKSASGNDVKTADDMKKAAE